MGEHRATTSTSVCVTGASGFIGSWLVMTLLQRGYCVRATVRDPANEKKVNHLLSLPNASTHLSLWKADLNVQGSFDDSIHGCEGVFHVATPMEFTSSLDAEDKLLKSTVDGVLNIMRSCSKAKTVKRFIFTSTIATINVQPQQPVEYNESFWTDVDFCKSLKIEGLTYCVAKTMAEKAAWKYAEENGLAMVTVHPSLVIGPFLIPSLALSIETAISLFTRNEVLYPVLNGNCAVHVDDVCKAHIYLFEHPSANGRYICSSHNFNIFEIAKSLSLKYPEDNIPTEFDGFDKSKKVPPCSSKKLMDLGFEFAYIKHDVGELCAESIELCKHKGLL